MNLAIFASGTGSNAMAIVERARTGILKMNPVLIISNNPDAQVLQKATSANIPNKCINRSKFPNRRVYEQKLLEVVKQAKADCIALAGYMLLLSPEFLNNFNGPILNLHPALLPAFSGTKGILNAIEYGVKIIGASIHFVSEEMDRGPLIIQAAIPLRQGLSPEEITASIHGIEHRIYPQALQWIAEKRIHLNGRQTSLEMHDMVPAPAIQDCIVYPPLENGF